MAEDKGKLDGVFKFTNIARKGVPHQKIQRIPGDVIDIF